jgi:GNAT superfamily N-acetyltransferase
MKKIIKANLYLGLLLLSLSTIAMDAMYNNPLIVLPNKVDKSQISVYKDQYQIDNKNLSIDLFFHCERHSVAKATYSSDNENQTCSLVNFYVEPEWRSKGIGSIAFRMIMQEIAKDLPLVNAVEWDVYPTGIPQGATLEDTQERLGKFYENNKAQVTRDNENGWTASLDLIKTNYKK